MISADKKTFRREMLAERKALPAELIASRSELIAERLTALPEYRRADTLLCFIPTAIEVDTRPVITRAFAGGKKVAAPRCVPGGNEMRFYYINGFGDLEKGSFGISEPAGHCAECSASEASLCVVPALCCGMDGSRIGYGRGFYDRFLSDFPGVSCAVIFEDFLFGHIPTEPEDIPVMLTVTEKAVYRSGTDSLTTSE